MAKYPSRLSLILQITLLGGLSLFFLGRLFLPYSKKKGFSYFEMDPAKIVFEAKLNSKPRDILNLISFDTTSYIGSLRLWNADVFQSKLNEVSLFLTDLDLEIIQKWLISNQIDYYHAPFKGKIFFVFEGDDFPKEVEAKALIKNYPFLALENMIFLGLGLRDFLLNSSFYSQGKFLEPVLSPGEFLEALFKNPNLRVMIDKKLLPKRSCKVKIIIFK